MNALKTETKQYGPAIRLYFKDEDEYETWISRLKEISLPENTSDSVETLLEKIEKRKNSNTGKVSNPLGDINTLLFMTEVAILASIFMDLVFYVSEIDTKYKSCESILTSLMDGTRG